MSVETFHSPNRATDRHVSAHTARRIGRYISAILLALCLIGPLAFAEAGGTGAELAKETPLKAKPDDSSRSKGKLPRGTILMLTGERANGFVQVEVELETGDISGWVLEDTLKASSAKTPIVEEHDDSGDLEVEVIKKKPVKDASGTRVPKDELALLKRDPTFFYGLHAGGHYSLIEVNALRETVGGPGMTIGAQIGFFVAQKIPLYLELGYTRVGGTTLSNRPIGFGLFDIGANIAYELGAWEFFAGVKYSMGISIVDLPNTVTLSGPMDVSSPWGQLGVGYRVNMSEQIDLVFRGRYGISFLRSPIGFQTMGITAYVEIRG